MKTTAILTTLLCYAVLAASAQTSQSNFSLKGDLSKLNGYINTVVLMYPVNNEYISDTAKVTNGQFSFSGSMPYPTMGTIKYLGAMEKPYSESIFLENGLIKITATNDSLNNLKIEGSNSHQEYLSLKSKDDAFTKETITPLGKQITAARINKDTANLKALRVVFLEKLNQHRKTLYLDYVDTHPESPLVYYCLIEGGGIPFNPLIIKPYFERLPEKARQSAQGIAMREVLEIGLRIKPGSYAPDFTLKNTAEAEVNLFAMRGKYVLIDFWASWCAPCRKEMPNVMKAFQSYKDQGFSVLAVSIDEPGAQDKWIRAIATDRTEAFVHVLSMKGSTNDVAKRYGVAQIPANFLLNPEGMIIAVNLREEALQKKLKEIFK